jgi:predicted lipid-binding transport protein (Tim44 family)
MDEGTMSVLNDHQATGEPARASSPPQALPRSLPQEKHGTLAAGARVDPRKLWSGGAASAAVAGLVALVGVLVTRWLFALPVLAPSQDGAYGDVSTTALALLAAAAALAATGLVHLLIVNTPRPFLFFGWIVTLVTTLVVVYPFSTTAPLDAKIATAAVELAIGAMIGTLVGGAAARSTVGDGPAETGDQAYLSR